MINVQTLGMLLRTLHTGEAPGRGAVPLQPLAPAQAVKPIAPEGAQSQRPGAFDPGRSEPGQRDAPTHGATTAPKAGADAASRAATRLPTAPSAGATPGVSPTGRPEGEHRSAQHEGNPVGTLPPRSADASAVVTLASLESTPPIASSPNTAVALPATASTATPVATTTSTAAPTTMPPTAAPGTPTGASLSLSPTAQFVDTLLRLPGGRPIVPAAPLVPAPGGAPEALARALQHSIVASGLFYESHLARWVGHRLPDSALRQEPQAAWPAPPAATGASPAAAPAPWLAPAGLPLPDPDAPLPAASTPAATTPPAPTGTGVPDGAPALVRAQLDLLETGQILWRGDLWHGQPATIEVREDNAGRDPGTLPAWHTRLAVTLPGLGAVEARIALAGTRIHVSLVAADEARAAPLDAALPELAAALAARGLDVAPIRIDHGHAR